MTTFFFALLAVILLSYIGILFAACLFFVYPPRSPVFFNPAWLGMQVEDVRVPDASNPEFTVPGWFMPVENPKGVVVASHGFMMNRSELSVMAPICAEEGFAFYCYDFPGHGVAAKGKVTMGLAESQTVLGAVSLAKQRFPGAPIVLMGTSMGSAASAFALSQDPTCANAAILDSAYSRLDEAILGWWRFLFGAKLMWIMAPTVWVGRFFLGMGPKKVNVTDALSKIDVPVLILHGDRDTLASVAAGKRNFDALKGPKRLVWFEGFGHSEFRWLSPEKYISEVRIFLKQVADDSFEVK
jgi:hypothetical protein